MNGEKGVWEGWVRVGVCNDDDDLWNRHDQPYYSVPFEDGGRTNLSKKVVGESDSLLKVVRGWR